jgi:hypothetical protein
LTSEPPDNLSPELLLRGVALAGEPPSDGLATCERSDRRIVRTDLPMNRFVKPHDVAGVLDCQHSYK